MEGETGKQPTSKWILLSEDEGKRAILILIHAPPVLALQHVVALLTVVILRPPALFVAARPECVHLDMLLQELHIVLSEIILEEFDFEFWAFFSTVSYVHVRINSPV